MRSVPMVSRLRKRAFFLRQDENPAGAVGESLDRVASRTPLRGKRAAWAELSILDGVGDRHGDRARYLTGFDRHGRGR
jgi:hypothetical protein